MPTTREQQRDTRRRMAERVRQGAKPADLARAFGVSVTCVTRACRESGFSAPRPESRILRLFR